MPRTIDATLKAALASGTFSAFFQLGVGFPIQYIQVVSFTLSPFGELKVKAVTNTELLDIDYVILRRGVTINGTQYYLDTSQLLAHTVTYDGNYLTVEADILAKMKISIAADVTYTTLLTNLVSQFGKSIDRKNPSAGFWGNTFYPTGKSLTLNRVSQIRAILKQKFFMGLTDYGNNTIRFFFADNTFSDGTITVKQLVKPETTYNYGLIASIGLLWRNDARTVFKPNIDSYPLYNIGYVKDNDYIPYANGASTTTINAASRIKGLQVGVEPITLAPNLEYLTGDQVQLFSSTNNLSSVGTLLVEEYLDTNKEPAWGIKISLWDYVTSTEGGALPGTIERSAPYTPLNTSEFNAVLSYTDNNIQAAMETLDDHVHAAGSGDLIEGGAGGVVGQVAEFVTDDKHLQAAKIIGPATHILTLTTSAAVNLTIPATGTLMLAGNNLSDLTNAATARTNLGLVAGGLGDIWVEKAGDTMTGLLTVTPSTPGNSITTTGEVTINTGANAEPGLTIVGNGFFQTGKLFTINDNYWGDRLTVDKLGQVVILLNPGTVSSVGLQVVSSPNGASTTTGLQFNVTQYGNGTYAKGFVGATGAYAYLTDAYINQAYAGETQIYLHAEATKTVSWTDAVGLNIQAPSIIGAGTKTGTNIFGARIYNQGNANNTNSYGIWLDDQSGSATLNYAIYTKAGDIRLMASNSDKIGFHGVTPVARQLLATGGGATVDQVITALQTLGLLRQT